MSRYGQTERELRERVEDTAVDRVTEALNRDTGGDCPGSCLCHNPTPKRIAELVVKFNDGTLKTDGVYVLECKPRHVTQRTVREELELQHDSRWVERAQNAERLLYVGMSVDIPNRLKQHAQAKGAGANFTQMFPASRVLSVQWVNSKSLAYRAEEITAEVLRENITDGGVYVAQPG